MKPSRPKAPVDGENFDRYTEWTDECKNTLAEWNYCYSRLACEEVGSDAADSCVPDLEDFIPECANL